GGANECNASRKALQDKYLIRSLRSPTNPFSLIVVYARPHCKGKGGRPRLALVLREAAVGGFNPLGFLPKQVYTNNSPLVSKARNTGTLLWITARTSSFVAPASTTFATSTSNCPATG